MAIVLMSAVGSTVHGMPVVASLRRAWPDTRISWVMQPGPRSLMGSRLDVDDFILFRRHLGLSAYPRFRQEVAGRRFDLVVCLQPNFKGGAVTRLLSAPLRLGYDRPRARDLSWLATNRRIPARSVAHTQDEMFEFLDFLGVEPVPEWDFHFTEQEIRVATEWRERASNPVLAVIPRSSNLHRNPPLELLARVIDAAQTELGLEVVLLGGASGPELADQEALTRMCSTTLRLELGGTLRTLSGRLAVSDMVLAPDTGPLHMAVALGTPTVGLYGGTDPNRSGPYRRFKDLLVDAHPQSGRGAPSMATCRGRMERIQLSDVLDKLERALHVYVRGRDLQPISKECFTRRPMPRMEL